MSLDLLLPYLACPVSGDPLRVEGACLVSTRGARYPIIDGVPRLLPPDLLGPLLREAFPARLAADSALAAQIEAAASAPPEPEVQATLTAYNLQHVEMADEALPVDDWRATWDRFQPGLPPAAFADQAVLEIGSGEGRHASLVGGAAKLMVGLDLSRGVELARARDDRRHVFFVQGDLRRPPFRPGAFDALYSNGVLHHTPDPGASFKAVTPLVRAGGRVSVWVYGLDEMRLSYRLSHLTWLRPLTNRMPKSAQVATAWGLTAAVEAALWTPARALDRLGRPDLAARLPYHDAAARPWRYKLRRMFDRLNPPITHYLSRADLEGWMAGFEAVEILNTEGQGWCARGVVA
ncbi:class I SAM-dependent methyltransferase [Myxococcota bacterium]|nr:class I SAM-dependent methyltransferase [Myxococcota bacterium]MBU1430939.1 class I SAM-dependent methyltransferase [Myxococcota bacterium]MBU1899530.1 class I SAM-dependent methyltransferase [Myxococcota bacterium]